jgi:hypothetical protein
VSGRTFPVGEPLRERTTGRVGTVVRQELFKPEMAIRLNGEMLDLVVEDEDTWGWEPLLGNG